METSNGASPEIHSKKTWLQQSCATTYRLKGTGWRLVHARCAGLLHPMKRRLRLYLRFETAAITVSISLKKTVHRHSADMPTKSPLEKAREFAETFLSKNASIDLGNEKFPLM